MYRYKPIQLAYFVTDIRAAATKMSAMTGAGPFFVIEDIELEWCRHRERDCRFVHSSAYGQWGDMMLELVQQEEEGPSPFRDMYQAGDEGIHHVACFVDSIDEGIAHYAQQGIETATRAKAVLGTEFAFIDTSPQLGHMLEIYQPTEALVGFYDLVREASKNWDEKELFSRLDPSVSNLPP